MKLIGGPRPRPNRVPAIIALAGLSSLVIGSAGVVIWSSYAPPTTLPAGIEKLPPLPPAPAIPNDPMELAFGSDRPDWNLSEFNVEGTANNPSVYANVSKEDARRFNQNLPFATELGAPARPFILTANSPLERSRAMHCMSLAVYYEAGSESASGQHAVAQVVINRMRHPAWPHSVCGVVFQGSERPTGCQFTFTCDGALKRPPSGRRWRMAQAVASSALSGYVATEVGLATHYHTDWVAPRWAPSLKKLTQLGTHIFYTWKGKGGTPVAFTAPYPGKEAWPRKAAATAPELGEAIIEPDPTDGSGLSEIDLAKLNALRTPNMASQPQGGTNGLEQNQIVNVRARAESLAAQQSSASGLDDPDPATPFSLPAPGKDGLMPDPDISQLVAKPRTVPEQASPRAQSAQAASPATQQGTPARDKQSSRALDGL